MFTLLELLSKMVDKILPNRDSEKIAKVVIVVMDIVVLALVIGFALKKNEVELALANSFFREVIRTLILSVILGSAINSRLFSGEDKKEDQENKTAIKLLLYTIPAVLILLPVMFEEALRTQLVFNYVLFVLLTNVVLNIIDKAYNGAKKEKRNK